jgi:hypothetical protein
MQSEAVCHVCLMLPGKPGLRNLQSAIYRQYPHEYMYALHACMLNRASCTDGNRPATKPWDLRASKTCPVLSSRPHVGPMLMRSASFDNKENSAPPKSMGTARSDRTPLSTESSTYHCYSSTDEYEYETYTTGRYDTQFRLPGPSTVDGHFQWQVEAIMAVRAGWSQRP